VMATPPRRPRGKAREQIEKDFKNFVFHLWKHLLLPPPTPVQYDIADYLQYGPRRKIIEGFRGVAKSWITSMFVLWTLNNDPERKFLIVSASKQRADDFSTFTQRLIKEVPLLQHLMPRDDQRNSKIAFDVGPARPAHAPSVKSVGIFGQMTGSRATDVVADDVEVLNNSDTEDKREKLMQTVSEFEAIIVPDIATITFLGTPQTEASIYNKLARKGYVRRMWPSRYPSPEKVQAMEGSLAPMIIEALEKNPDLVGQPVDPLRFNHIDLMEREAAYGKAGFALQFQLDTTLSDAERYPLKTSDLIVLEGNVNDKAPVSVAWGTSPAQQIKELTNVGFDGDRYYRPFNVDPQWVPFEGSVMAIDPAGRGGDELAYAVVKQLHGYLYPTATGGLKGGYSDENLIHLATVAKEQNIKYCVIESNFGDGMFTKIFTPILAKYHPTTMEEIRHNIQKERRIIDTLEPVMMNHRLVFPIDVIKKDLKAVEEGDVRYSLMYQLTHITRDRGSLKADDRLDVLAMAVAYWVESVSRDLGKALQAQRERDLDLELRKFMNSRVLITPKGVSMSKPNWMTLPK
jgi:hypothetical protein